MVRNFAKFSREREIVPQGMVHGGVRKNQFRVFFTGGDKFGAREISFGQIWSSEIPPNFSGPF